MIDAATVREMLDYDAETGAFTWCVGERNQVKTGDMAGHRNVHGYIVIGVHGRIYQAHRLAWLHVHGEWPPNEIDHINGVRDDNRLANLRMATSLQNKANAGRRRDNARGTKGVSWVEQKDKWRCRIRINGKQKHLGYFDAIEDATEAYRRAAEVQHGDFARA